MHCAGVKDLQVVGTECPFTLPAHRVGFYDIGITASPEANQVLLT